MSLIRLGMAVSRSKDAPLSQLVHPDLPKGANYGKSIANSAIEIARIFRIDFYYHVKIESNVAFPAKLLFSDAIRNGRMIQMEESLVVNGLTGLK